MRILITGMNAQQCTRDYYLHRSQLKVVPSHYSLLRCLKDMGHEVVQGSLETTKGQRFDRVIFFLAGHRQFAAVNFYSGLELLSSYPEAVLAFDDWQTEPMFKGLQSCTDSKELYNSFTLKCNKIESLNDFTKEQQNAHSRAIEIILAKKNRVLLSCFAGGRPELLVPEYSKELLYTYNPNPYHLNRYYGHRDDVAVESDIKKFNADYVNPFVKEKKFNFASLVQSSTVKWLKTQNITEWEIEFFGSKSKGQRRLKEGEMVKVFGEQWGCLMPGYSHSGSGWWRARPLQVAMMESILIGDPKELEIYYGDNEFSRVRGEDVEKMSVSQLTDFARGQAQHLYGRHPLDKEVQKDELKKAIE